MDSTASTTGSPGQGPASPADPSDISLSPPPVASQGSPVHPVDAAQRLPVIDVLRGVALLGILLMNIPGFAMSTYFDEAFKSNPADPRYWLLALITVVFEGKMRALFGMIFGAGIVLFTQKKEAVGKPVVGLFYRRMFWLVLFGLIHAHLILWVGDILYLYGVCGMLVYPLKQLKVRYLFLAVPLVALLDFTGSTVFYRDLRRQRLAYVEATETQRLGKQLTAAQTNALEDWHKVEKSLIPSRDQAAADTHKMKSDYAGVASVVRPLAYEFEFPDLWVELSDSMALMLFGIGLYRSGFFSGQWAASRYRQIALVGYGLGLPLVAYSFYYSTVNYPNIEAYLAHLERVPMDWMGLIYPFQRILLVFAHVSVLILLFQSGLLRPFLRRLASVGQMAFTNYILHSVVCTLFFFGYGLNFYAELGYFQMYGVVLIIWGVQLLVSPWWLQHFRFGPLEWVWRSLTYWRWQPILIRNEKAVSD